MPSDRSVRGWPAAVPVALRNGHPPPPAATTTMNRAQSQPTLNGSPYSTVTPLESRSQITLTSLDSKVNESTSIIAGLPTPTSPHGPSESSKSSTISQPIPIGATLAATNVAATATATAIATVSAATTVVAAASAPSRRPATPQSLSADAATAAITTTTATTATTATAIPAATVTAVASAIVNPPLSPARLLQHFSEADLPSPTRSPGTLPYQCSFRSDHTENHGHAQTGAPSAADASEATDTATDGGHGRVPSSSAWTSNCASPASLEPARSMGFSVSPRSAQSESVPVTGFMNITVGLTSRIKRAGKSSATVVRGVALKLFSKESSRRSSTVSQPLPCGQTRRDSVSPASSSGSSVQSSPRLPSKVSYPSVSLLHEPSTEVVSADALGTTASLGAAATKNAGARAAPRKAGRRAKNTKHMSYAGIDGSRPHPTAMRPTHSNDFLSRLPRLRAATVARDAEAESGSIGDVEDLGYTALCTALHTRAVAAGARHYLDPKTGFLVNTALEARARGYCCGSECRHCPYNHVNVGRPDQVRRDALAMRRQRTEGGEPAGGVVAVGANPGSGSNAVATGAVSGLVPSAMAGPPAGKPSYGMAKPATGGLLALGLSGETSLLPVVIESRRSGELVITSGPELADGPPILSLQRAPTLDWDLPESLLSDG